MNDLSKCGEACNCAKCRVTEVTIQYKEATYVPSAMPFHELNDGDKFRLAPMCGEDIQEVLQKTLEAGTNYNAVSVNNTNMGHDIAPYVLVIPVKE